jgi:DNA polymerase-3 subunit alpha
MTVDQIAEFAANNNQKAIAITNHGYMTSYVDFVKACNTRNVKPIIGCEIYEVDDMYEKADTKNYIQPRYHLVLLCKNKTGLNNLFKIVSVACTDGFYKKPRVSIDYIEKNKLGDGLICLTACQAGRMSRFLEQGKETDVKEFYDKLNNTFDSVYCEIQSHSTDSQVKCNKNIANFINKYNLPYVITTDAHMVSSNQLDLHAIFVSIGEGREVGESYVDCYLQTDDDVYRILGNQFSKDFIAKGIEETSNISSLIEDIDIGINKGNIMPKINIEGNFNNNQEYLRYLVYKDFDKKFGHLSHKEQQKRRDRIKSELPVLFALDYTDYFIMLYMLAQKADERKIPRGYSRGSGANCLCLYMLGVTQIDSVKWDLDFSRFANLGRKSVADFDWDISKRRRREFIEISEDLFGKDNVAPIATFNTLSTKVAIRDIGKVLDEKPDSPYYKKIPYSLRDEVAKMIPTIKTLNDLGEEEEKDVLLKEVLFKNEKLERVYEEFPLWFQYVMGVEGLPKSIGRHAAGTLITPIPVINYCPVCYDSDDNIMVQLEMHNAMDDLGLTKMDYLGLETLDVIDDTLKMAGLTWDDVDINHLNLEDKEVYNKVYKTGNTVGMFQMESAEAKRMCIEANVDNIEDVIVINAANRPGTKDNFPTYCFNKLNPDKVEVLHEDLKNIFNKTQYVLLYQEQALSLFRYAGFPEEEVDNARRAIGKKKKEVMQELRDKFIIGMQHKGWNDEQCEYIWRLMLKQAEYSFNRGHAVAYGLLSYLTAYLKTHYAKYFMTACLTAKSDKVEKISVLINECNRLGIKVSPPNVNKSNATFTAINDREEILFGLMAIKGLGKSIVDKILELRPFESFQDFKNKISDKSAIITLIKAGALPTKDKKKLLKKYAESLFEFKQYTPVNTYKTKHEMLSEWGIDVDQYKNGKKIDRERILEIYNQKRKEKYDQQQLEKYKKFMQDFYNKYVVDEYMWEFETLSMFITNDPLKEAYKHITDWDLVKDGAKATVLCVIVDIKRKKDKNGNQFAYLDLYTPYGIIESTCWSSQLKEYSKLIKKGKCLAILGRRRENHLFVEAIKPYEQWIKDRQLAISI